jgi:hypothetical protein
MGRKADMKTRNAILIIGIALSSFGCGKFKGSGSAASDSGLSDGAPAVEIPGSPFVPDGSGPGSGPGDNWEYGGTAALKVNNLGVMGDYTGRAMNNPQDIRINLNLKKYGKGYGGVVSIAYTDNGQQYEGHFTSGTSSDSNKYNVWFTKSGTRAYHGFFEDFMGGIIIVIDHVIDLGDGGIVNDLAGGSVWYKNFGLTYAPNPLYGSLPGFGHPGTYCWFISLGPYDCRAWKDGRNVNTTRAIEPDNNYVKLGTFENMSLEEAFNGELN